MNKIKFLSGFECELYNQHKWKIYFDIVKLLSIANLLTGLAHGVYKSYKGHVMGTIFVLIDS